MTVSQSSKRTRPERRKMRATLQSSQEQKGYGPESHDDDGDKSKRIKNPSAVQDAKDAAKEEQSTNLNAAQGGY